MAKKVSASFSAIEVRDFAFELAESLSSRDIDRQRSALRIARFPRPRRRPASLFASYVCTGQSPLFYLPSAVDGERVRNAIVRNDGGTTFPRSEFVSEGRGRNRGAIFSSAAAGTPYRPSCRGHLK